MLETPESWLTAYEAAISSQQWVSVAPLMHDSVSVTFSDGSVHRGIEAVRIAYEHNFRLIQNEVYRMENPVWTYRNEQLAIAKFSFSWSGMINGSAANGRGFGTLVLVKSDAGWLLIAEHLGIG